MNLAPLSAIVMAAITFYVGHYHLMIFIRRKAHREDLYFALTCIGLGLYDLMSAGLWAATSVQAGALWQRRQFLVLPFFTTLFLWFAAEYTAQRRRIFVYGYSAFSLISFLVQALDRSNLTWILDRPSVKEIAFPFGLRMTYYEASMGPFSSIQGLLGFVACTYIIWIAIRAYRRGAPRRAGPLLIALLILYAAAFNDTAVSQGLYQFVYLIEFASLALVMVMSLSLARDVVGGAMAEERFRALVETSSDWVWEVDRNVVYTYCSPKAKDLLGYDPQELIGLTPFDLMPPEEARCLEPVLREFMKSGRPLVRVESRAISRDGRPLYLETSAEPFFDQSGKLLGYRGIDRDITDRLQAEAARRESETLFRTLVENSPAGIFLVDDRFAFQYVNDETCRILGYSRDELNGRDFRLFLDEESRELVAERYQRRQRGEAVVPRYEIWIRHKNGSRRLLELASAVFRAADGSMRTMGQILDITEGRETEKALRQAHTVVVNSPAVVFRWRAEPGWPVDLVSENVSRFGYSPAELLCGAVPYSNLVHPEDLERVAGEVQRFSAAGLASFEQEYRIVTRNGDVRWVDDRTVVERNARGEPVYYQGVVVDITERKRLERETEERRAFLERILATAPDAIVTADSQHAILEWNPGAQRLFGYSRGEAIGHRIDELITGGNAQVAAEAARWTELLAQAGAVPLSETVRYRKDGTPVDVLVSVAPIMAGTELLGVVAIYADIREQKKAEKEIRLLNASLEQRVQQRTSELQAVNKELEAFAYSVSHDLRAPLRGIDGFSKALEEDCGELLPAKGRQYVGSIRAAARRMGELIDGLLGLSRIARGTIHMQEVNLSALAREIVDTLARRSGGRKVEFRIAEGLEADCDQQLIRAALENLLENAWKFTGKRAQACVEFGRETVDGEEAFFVRDNGAGFDMAYADRLFNVFQRLHRAEEFPGIGLGLANVQRIIHRHGGRVWAEGRVEGGATFWFTLAAAK